MTQTSLREELCVDVFEGFFIDNPAGAFLKDRGKGRSAPITGKTQM